MKGGDLMKKLSILSLIIVSNLVTNVEAMENQSPGTIKREMQKKSRELSSKLNRVLVEIQNDIDPLTKQEKVEDLNREVVDTIEFLKDRQMHGMIELSRARQTQKGMENMLRDARAARDSANPDSGLVDDN